MSSEANSGPGSAAWDELIARLFRTPEGRQPVYRVDIGKLLSAEARELLVDAARRAGDLGAADIDTNHILWASLQRHAMRSLIYRSGTDPDALLAELNRETRQVDGAPPRKIEEGFTLTPGTKRALLQAHQISRTTGSSYIGPEHLLMALASNPDSPAGRMLAKGRVTPETLQAAKDTGSGAGPGGGGASGRGRETAALDQFGHDLTAMARDGKLEPVVGREEQIEQAVEVLSRRTKNNPVLIGEAGVGKTAIVEGIAERIVEGDVPQTLHGKRVIQLDLAGLVAGTRYRGDFEERIKKVLEEVRTHGDEMIIFLDEVHTLVGVGSSGSEGGMDAGNMLKPALARGDVHVIGATTVDEYRRTIERDAALARRFQPILVPEPTVDDTVAILRGLRDGYEAHHQVRFTDGALQAAADLSDRYLADRFLPDKAIDLIDLAGARARLRSGAPEAGQRETEQWLEQLQRDKEQAVTDEQYERATALRDQIAEVRTRLDAPGAAHTGVPVVDVAEIAEVVSRSTGIPVSQLTEEERERLLRLETQLRQRVIGQDEAVTAVAEAVRRSRAGLADPERPVGSFLFLGPTGVGKTELARSLAETLFGDQDRMVRLDMSEYSERHTISRLVGAPPGYVGYGDAGQLTETVRRRPYTVILLDEIEKAHQDVFNVLLQVLEDGRLTDSQGRTVSFRHAVLIMTSNAGSDVIGRGRQAIGFGGGATEANGGLSDELMRELRQVFRPEFLNRIDAIIAFRRLEKEHLRQIVELLLEQTRRRLHAQNVTVTFTPAAIDWIADRGYEPEFGARPMRRAIQRDVDNRLSSMLLSGELSPGAAVIVDSAGDELAMSAIGPSSTPSASPTSPPSSASSPPSASSTSDGEQSQT